MPRLAAASSPLRLRLARLSALFFIHERCDLGAVGRARHPALGDERGHELRGRHVENRVQDGDTGRRPSRAAIAGYFGPAALLDRNVVASRDAYVYRGQGTGDVEGYG